MAVAREPLVASPLRRAAISRLGWQASRQWPLAAVLALFTATAFIVPTLAPVATTDDWGYSRLVEILVQEHRLTVFPVVAATAVFQVGWGAIFALTLGMTLGVMRIATLVMVGLGGAALYALLRELSVSRSRAALGVAAYLFNPLGFILSYTFMTDPYLTALLIGSTYCYVRGLRVDGRAGWATAAGSTIAACAFLTRQQGALIPLAVVTYLLLARRLWFDWASARRLLETTAIPTAAAIGYYLWLTKINNVPAVQQGFFNEAKNAGAGATWKLTRHLAFIELTYAGFFALPLTVGLLPWARTVVLRLTPRGWIAVCLCEVLLAIGLTYYAVIGGRFPYIPQFMGRGGLGPRDVLGGSFSVFTYADFYWTTIVVAVATAALAFLFGLGVSAEPSPERAGAALVAAIAVWQVAGVLPPSFHYLTRGYSLDRYLLPLLPLTICLVLWATRDLPMLQPAAWTVLAAFLVFSVVATHDYFAYMNAVWNLASEANAAGVENTKLDAGAAWDGYHIYTYALDHGIYWANTPTGPWWMTFYGLASDSTYVVSASPRLGYVQVWERDYDVWFSRDNEAPHLYLLRKPAAAGLPAAP